VGAWRDLAGLPDVRRIELAWGLAVVGWTSCTVAILVYAYDEGGAALLAAYSFARAVWGAVAAMVSSGLGDRIRRDRILRVTTGARVLLVASGAAIAMAEGPAGLVVTLVVLADGLASAFRPLQAAALPWLVRTPGELASANVAATVMESSGSLLGPLLAGVALLLGDPSTALAVSAVWVLLATVSLLRLSLPDDSLDTSADRRHPWRDVVVGSSALMRLRPIGGLATLALVQTIARGALMVGLVVFAFDVLDLDEDALGWLNATMGLGGLLGGVIGIAVVRSSRLGRTFVAGVVLWGIALVLVALWPVTALAFLAMLLIGVGNAYEDASMFTLLPRQAGPRVTGRVLGALELLIVTGIGIGSVMAPWLIDAFGSRATFGIVGVLVLAAAACYFAPFAALDRSLPEPGPEVDVLRKLPMFAPLPLVTVECLADELEERDYALGSVVMRQGEPGDLFHVVASGRALVEVDGLAKPPLGPGDCFGEIALLRETPRTATITAETDLVTYTLARAVFLRAVTGNKVSTSSADELASRRLASDAPPD
jgi:MFS family permease